MHTFDTAPPRLCPLSPCDGELFSTVADLGICPSNQRCVRATGIIENILTGAGLDPERVGHCQAGSQFLDSCEVADQRCGNGTFCAGAECERAAVWHDLNGVPPADRTGLCVLPAREGSRCDDNVDPALRTDPMTGDVRPIEGCSPCEPGTVCVPTAASGIGEPGDARCVRLCDDGGDSVCGCGVSVCEDLLAPAEHPITGDPIGSRFCTPCTASNADECDPDVPCCDQANGASCESFDLSPEITRSYCCLGPGHSGECGGDAYNGGCCPGTRCSGTGECVPCGVDGDVATVNGCCPGFVAVESAEGIEAPVCRHCSLRGGACADEYVHVIGGPDGTSVDSIAVNETDLAWWAVEDGSGGELQSTAGNVTRVRYRLTDDHRAYLFTTELSEGVGAGSLFLQLPQPPPGEEVEIETPIVEFSSARVYDIGACSVRLSWPLLANILALAFNSALDDVPYSNPLSPSLLRVSPVIRATALEPARLPLGILIPNDAVDVHAEYTTDSVGGCTNQTLSIDVRLRLQSVDPWVFTDTTFVADQNVANAGIGCVLTSDPLLYRCTLLDRVLPNGTVETREVFLSREPSGAFDDAFSMMGCAPNRTDYICSIPVMVGSHLLRFDTRRHEGQRPHTFVANGAALSIDVESVSADLVDPCLGDWFLSGVGGRVRRAIGRVNSTLGDRLAEFLGDSLVEDYLCGCAAGDEGCRSAGACSPDGHPACCATMAGTIPECGPPGTPEHLTCPGELVFGGFQHTCQQSPGDGVFRCDGARLDFRRVHVTPDGIELVLAETTSDPQFALNDGRPGFVPESSPLVALAPVDPLRCDPSRYITEGLPDSDTISEGAANPLLVPPRPICRPDAMGCSGICGEVGTTCANAGEFGLLQGLDGSGLCDLGRCRR